MLKNRDRNVQVSRPQNYALNALWVPGVAAVIIVLFFVVFGLKDEASEWGLYLCLGILFPLLAVGLLVIENKVGEDGIAPHKRVLGVIFVAFVLAVWALCWCGTVPHILALVLAVLTVTVAAFGRRTMSAGKNDRAEKKQTTQGKKRQKPGQLESGVERNAWNAVAPLAVSLLLWIGAMACIYWISLYEWLMASWYTMVIFVFSMALVWAGLFFEKHPRASGRVEQKYPRGIRAFRLLGHGLAILAFGVLSSRTRGLFATSPAHHWSFWIGPIQTIRDGGWLLWDVPSQYGFLSILLPSLLPIKSAWESFYVFQAALQWVVGTLVYFQLRRQSVGMLNYVFAFLVAMASVYFMPGSIGELIGPAIYPSVGAPRFVWCHVFMFLLWICLDTDRPRPWMYCWLGAVAWVLGTLWSAESAVYCTVIYGLSCGAIALQAAAVRQREMGTATPDRSLGLLLNESSRRVVGSFCLVPLALFALTLVAIAVFYCVRLGHAPDWPSFYEYAMVYKDGYGTIPIDANGPVWMLVGVFCLISAVGAAFVEMRPFDFRLAIVLGVFGAVWATGSYFVSRSHPNNACNLMPIVVTALALLLAVTRRLDSRVWGSFVRHAAFPVFVIVLLATYGNPDFIKNLSLSHEGWRHIEKRLPAMHGDVFDLIEEQCVGLDDPLACDNDDCLPLAWSPESDHNSFTINERSWLPRPLAMLGVLSPSRLGVYMQRQYQRQGLSGWLLVRKANPSNAEIKRQAENTHRITLVGENSNYALYWCTSRISTASLRRGAPVS